MQIVVVAALVVVKTLMDAPASRPAPWWSLVACACSYVLLAYLLTRWSARMGLRRLMAPSGAGLGRAPALVAMLAQVYLVAALAGLMLAGWGDRLTGLIGPVPLLATALALGPFVLALLAYWWAIYPLEMAVRARGRAGMALAGEPVLPMWSRRQHLAFNVRHNLLFVAVPAGAILLALDVLSLLAGRIGPTLVAAGAFAAGAGVFLVAPAMIVRVWRTRPLPDGPLRRRLEAFCRRIGLRYRDILIWETDGVILNAGVMGLLAPVRYVLLSDALLVNLDEDAVEAIFAHEAGHVVHHHILYMVIFTAGLGLLCTSAGEMLATSLHLTDAVANLPVLVAMGALWGVLFGMLSRRFERQADVFAASVARTGGGGVVSEPVDMSAEGVGLFGDALLSVARLNGLAPRQRNFRHGSIEGRLNCLATLLRTGRGRRLVDDNIRRMKHVLWALLMAGIVGMLAAAQVAGGQP